MVMARAMASDPAAMVLIAPTAGVDVASKRTLMDAVTAAADRTNNPNRLFIGALLGATLELVSLQRAGVEQVFHLEQTRR